MNEDAYATPKANLHLDEQVEIPQEILKKIKNAWVAGIVSVTFTVILTIISLSGTNIMGLDAYAFVDAVLMAVFTFGIYKKVGRVQFLCCFCLWPIKF